MQRQIILSTDSVNSSSRLKLLNKTATNRYKLTYGLIISFLQYYKNANHFNCDSQISVQVVYHC